VIKNAFENRLGAGLV